MTANNFNFTEAKKRYTPKQMVEVFFNKMFETDLPSLKYFCLNELVVLGLCFEENFETLYKAHLNKQCHKMLGKNDANPGWISSNNWRNWLKKLGVKTKKGYRGKNVFTLAEAYTLSLFIKYSKISQKTLTVNELYDVLERDLNKLLKDSILQGKNIDPRGVLYQFFAVNDSVIIGISGRTLFPYLKYRFKSQGIVFPKVTEASIFAYSYKLRLTPKYLWDTIYSDNELKQFEDYIRG